MAQHALTGDYTKNEYDVVPTEGSDNGPTLEANTTPATDHVDAITSDSALQDISLYEKKALIVNREIDAMGMGRYQWCIFALCGFGYLLDLLWAQAFGLVASPLQQELGFSDAELGNIFSSFSAGLTAGAFIWGVLVDIVGRYWAFNFTVLFSSVFGLFLGVPDSYNSILVLTAFVGFGVGGNIPIDTTITLEFLPQNRRYLLAALSVFQPIGVILCSGIAYGFIPFHSCATNLPSCYKVPSGQACCTKASNYGWRYLLFTIGGITLLVFVVRFLIFSFQESPKYLLYRGQDEKAVKVLQHIAKFNKRTCNVTLETFRALEDDASSVGITGTSDPVLGAGTKQAKAPMRQKLKVEYARLKTLFANFTMARLTILLWIIYMFDYWSFTIAGSYLPTIIKRKGSDLGLSLEDTYRSYVYIYLFGIPGVLVGVLLYRGRQFAMLFSSALQGASLFIFSVVKTQPQYIGVNGLEYFCQSMFNAVLYGWTPEPFPAPVRGTAAGLASFWGRIFSIISPLIAAHVLESSLNGVLYLAGAGAFVCTLAIALLPRKYLGAQSY